MLKKKYVVPSIAAVVGIVAGYLFYHFYGCTNGCPMTSNPFITTAYGGIAGFVLFYK
jgi:hypothetical protein